MLNTKLRLNRGIWKEAGKSLGIELGSLAGWLGLPVL